MSAARKRRRKEAPVRLPTIAMQGSRAAAIRATRVALNAADDLYHTAGFVASKDDVDVDELLTKTLQARRHLDAALAALELATIPGDVEQAA